MPQVQVAVGLGREAGADLDVLPAARSASMTCLMKLLVEAGWEGLAGGLDMGNSLILREFYPLSSDSGVVRY